MNKQVAKHISISTQLFTKLLFILPFLSAPLQISGPQMQQADIVSLWYILRHRSHKLCVTVIYLAPQIPQTLWILLVNGVEVSPLLYQYYKPTPTFLRHMLDIVLRNFHD